MHPQSLHTFLQKIDHHLNPIRTLKPDFTLKQPLFLWTNQLKCPHFASKMHILVLTFLYIRNNMFHRCSCYLLTDPQKHTSKFRNTHTHTASVNLRAGEGVNPCDLQPACLPHRHAVDTATRLPDRLGLIKHSAALDTHKRTHARAHTHTDTANMC